MRRFLCACLIGMTVLAGGCGRPSPMTAGGKPVVYWLQTLHDPDARARRKAALTLGNVGSADPAVVPALAGSLKDGDAGVRGEAVLALLKIGPAARAAVPGLTEAEKDPDDRVRAYAAKALEKVRGGS